MEYFKGIVVAIRQCGGCVEVVVEGESPGAFPIDNSCFRMISECEGNKWIGRPVEYEDANMRFLDSPEVLEEAEFGDHPSLPALPPRSTSHF